MSGRHGTIRRLQLALGTMLAQRVCLAVRRKQLGCLVTGQDNNGLHCKKNCDLARCSRLHLLNVVLGCESCACMVIADSSCELLLNAQRFACGQKFKATEADLMFSAPAVGLPAVCRCVSFNACSTTTSSTDSSIYCHKAWWRIVKVML